jgi:hypothetical protein
VTVNGDTLDEANETYLVTPNPTNATILDGWGSARSRTTTCQAHSLGRQRDSHRGNSGNVNATSTSP